MIMPMFRLVSKFSRPGFALGLSLLSICSLSAQTNTPPPNTYLETGCHEEDEPDLNVGPQVRPATPDWAENSARDVAFKGEPISDSAGAIGPSTSHPVGALTRLLGYTRGDRG